METSFAMVTQCGIAQGGGGGGGGGLLMSLCSGIRKQVVVFRYETNETLT